MPKCFSKQELLNLGLNAFAFELVQESYTRKMAQLGDIPESVKKLEFYQKGCKITVEPCDDYEGQLLTEEALPPLGRPEPVAHSSDDQ